MKHIYAFIILFSAIANAQVTVNFGNSICQMGDCTQLSTTYVNATQTTSYAVEPVGFSPYPFSQGNLIPIVTDDVWSTPIPLNFSFSFYGTFYNQLQIGTNGVLAFANTDDFCEWEFSTPIPDPEFPIQNAIYGVYQDLDMLAIADPQVQNVSYYVTGVSPHRAFVVNFNYLPLYDCGDSVGPQTSQIVLHELTNEINVYVLNRTPCLQWQEGRGLIGIQNADGTDAVAAPGRNTGDWTASNEGWRFYPTGGSTAVLEWFMDGVSLGESDPTITACQGDATYTAIVTYQNDGSPITYTDEVYIPFGTSLEQKPDPSDLYACSDNGMAQFDLTMALPTFLDGEPIENFELGFFLTQADAQNFANPISFPESFVAPDGTVVYVSAASFEYITGCLEVRPFTLHIGDGLPEGESLQYFEEGQTLNDLDVAGNGIAWYDMPQGGTLLPDDTPLMHNTIYYAQSEPVPGCDAGRGTVQRFAVTVLQENLATADFGLQGVKIAPNPAGAQLSIGGIPSGYSIEVTNLLGQCVMRSVSTDITSTIDCANWSAGTYLIRISDNSHTRILKVIKS